MTRKTMTMVLMFLLFFVSACYNQKQDRYDVIYRMEPVKASSSSSIEDKEPRPFTIGIVPKVTGIPYFNVVEDGAVEAAKDLNVNVIYDGPLIADAEQQIKVIEDMIKRKVDLLAISANDPKRLVPVLTQAKEQGIRVITWDADTLPEVRELFVNMVDPETLGRHLLDTLAWTMGEEGEYAIMTGALSASNLNEWIKWIRYQQTHYYPGMELVEIAATDDNPQQAYEVARELLNKHPDLKGIIGNSSVGPPAAAQVVSETGKKGDIKVVGLSTPNLMKSYLQDGSAQMATLWSPKKLGYLTVVIAKNLLEGNLPVHGQEIENVGSIRFNGDVVIMGEPLDFTRENVSQYDF
ncbi:putative secreted solute-binding lipoprotein [Paenibacillus vortex V453]|uniref:Putative secreted solute-binding lipoprotein n=1 Tax=Paenibacillus vortex V453 TaxID=715225 RepID=A0A2R9SPF0_9BACL|nr:autoinducer 2 ABC transporter substrate-binding protein [Paenibacillus vortex]EFU39238.1 putative secreted solute-binding lipoprotein [Paenibacillus vortex V453]